MSEDLIPHSEIEEGAIAIQVSVRQPDTLENDHKSAPKANANFVTPVTNVTTKTKKQNSPKTVKGPTEAKSGEKLEYSISEYDINNEGSLDKDKERIRWCFYIDGVKLSGSKKHIQIKNSENQKEDTKEDFLIIEDLAKRTFAIENDAYLYAKAEIIEEDGVKKNKLTIVFSKWLDGKKVHIEAFRNRPEHEPNKGYVKTSFIKAEPASGSMLGKQSTNSVMRIRVRNRLNYNDNQINQVGNFTVSITDGETGGEMFSREFNLSGNQYNEIDLSEIDDGDYILIISPEHVVQTPINWPSVGAGSGPDRIWLESRASVTISNNRIIGIFSENDESITFNRRNIDVRLRAIWSLSPNRRTRPNNQLPTVIIIHRTVGARPLPPFFLKNREQQEASGTLPERVRVVAAHYVIPRDGNITKLVHESEVANHAGTSWWGGRDNVNNFSIGIEIVHRNSDGSFTDIQYHLLIRLLRQIIRANPSISSNAIVGHSEIGVLSSPARLGRKANDPGMEFNWPLLENNGLGMIPAPESEVFASPMDATRVYQDFFRADQSASLPLSRGDYSNIIREINRDLRAIGYIVTSTNTSYNLVTKKTVEMFKRHFFTGQRRQSNNFYNDRFDFETAKMVKRLIYTLPTQNSLVTQASP